MKICTETLNLICFPTVHQVLTKYAPLPENIERLFADEVSSLVSNKLPGYQVIRGV